LLSSPRAARHRARRSPDHETDPGDGDPALLPLAASVEDSTSAWSAGIPAPNNGRLPASASLASPAVAQLRAAHSVPAPAGLSLGTPTLSCPYPSGRRSSAIRLSPPPPLENPEVYAPELEGLHSKQRDLDASPVLSIPSVDHVSAALDPRRFALERVFAVSGAAAAAGVVAEKFRELLAALLGAFLGAEAAIRTNTL
jgi:hypothetical protein